MIHRGIPGTVPETFPTLITTSSASLSPGLSLHQSLHHQPHLPNIDLLLSLQDLDEVAQLGQREGTPLYGAIGVVSEDQLAVAVGGTRLQHHLKRVVFIE